MRNNPLDFDGMLDRVTAGEQPLPDSLVIATMDEGKHDDSCTKQGEPVNESHLRHPRAKKTFDITLIRRDLSSRPAKIETDGNLPEVITWEGEYFKVNLFKVNFDLGEPYLYQQIYAERLCDIEVAVASNPHPSLPEAA